MKLNGLVSIEKNITELWQLSNDGVMVRVRLMTKISFAKDWYSEWAYCGHFSSSCSVRGMSIMTKIIAIPAHSIRILNNFLVFNIS